jgi:hypothetical protein
MKWDAPLNQYPLECGANYGGCKMIKDRNIDPGAHIQLSKIAGLGLGPITGETFYVAKDGIQARTWLDGRVPGDHLFLTIDEAINKCVAERGDVIIVAPGHAETVTAAAGIDIDVANVSIIGIGNGSDRPTISFTTATTADIDIDADNILIDNIYFDLTGVDELAAPIDVNAANCTIKNCEFLMADASGQAVNAITTDVNAGNMKVLGCKFLAPNAGAAEAIKIVGAINGVEIKNCFAAGDFSVAPIHNPTGNIATNLLISDCVLKNDNAGEFALELVSACTGSLVRNFYHTDTLATAVDPGACFSFECYACHQVDKNGVLTPGVDS